MANEHGAVESQLVRLMKHIIKWLTQRFYSDKGSWQKSIDDARSQIEKNRKIRPSITKNWILSLWEKCFKKATKEAEDEMRQDSNVEGLTWDDVFEKPFDADNDDSKKDDSKDSQEPENPEKPPEKT